MRTARLGGWTRRRKCQGQSLIVALVAIAFLTAVGGAATMMLLLENRFAAAQKYRVRAHYFARAGLTSGAALLLADETPFDSLTDSWAADTDALRYGTPEAGAFVVEYADPATGERLLGVEDLHGKLNVNTAAAETLQRLFPNAAEEWVKDVLDRRPFLSVAQVPPLQQAAAGPKPEDVLTVYGDGTVNVNTASAPVLAAVTGLARDEVEKLLDARSGDAGPFKSVAQVREIVDLPQGDDGLTVSSDYFALTATGQLYEYKAVLRETVRRDADGSLTVVCFEQLQ